VRNFISDAFSHHLESDAGLLALVDLLLEEDALREATIAHACQSGPSAPTGPTTMRG